MGPHERGTRPPLLCRHDLLPTMIGGSANNKRAAFRYRQNPRGYGQMNFKRPHDRQPTLSRRVFLGSSMARILDETEGFIKIISRKNMRNVKNVMVQALLNVNVVAMRMIARNAMEKGR